MPYTITPKTLALISNGKKTKVYELNKNIIVNENINPIISSNCLLNGSTFEGRQKATSYLTGITYKPPIVLDNHHEIILIPTHSTRNTSCSWINLTNILNYYPSKKGVIVEFRNKKKIYINISFNVFDNQVLRATRLESSLRGRNNKK
ncbi:MAG: competence protein ComK [Ruminococcus sp.]|nr:competence protein ComK [Ruminococcus sp.]